MPNTAGTISTNRPVGPTFSAAPRAGTAAPPAPLPRGVSNGVLVAGDLMPGMQVYGTCERKSIFELLEKDLRKTLSDDYGKHGEKLNDREWILSCLTAEQARAHGDYRALCTGLENPGSYCIRRDEQGHLMLVHRSGQRPEGSTRTALVRTPLHQDGDDWRLDVAKGASAGWGAVRGQRFATLDALKAALPQHMREVAGASVTAGPVKQLQDVTVSRSEHACCAIV